MLNLFRYIIMLLCFSTFTVYGETDSSYQIEVIVFSHITSDALRSEYWSIPPSLTLSEKIINLSNDQILSEKQWQLKSEHQSLLRGRNLILLHMAWRDSASSLQKGKIIHLIGGDVYGDNIPQLNGSLAIRLEHYFNLHFNLQFLIPWSMIQNLNLTNIARNPEDEYAAFDLNEKLRMRSNELNYIDHPLYGILIKIIPVSN